MFAFGLGRVKTPWQSRRLEREASRNVEVMWLTGRLLPDHENDCRFPHTRHCGGYWVTLISAGHDQQFAIGDSTP
jgi:hypothetical protein